MASPENDDDKSKSQQGSSSSSAAAATTDNNHGPSSTSNPNPPPTTNVSSIPPPETMGYPPVIGYPPGGQQPYPPYNGYPYGGAPPPQGYYPNNSHLYPHSQQGTDASGFARGVLTALIALVLLSCMASIVMYLVLRPEAPVFRMADFRVNNLNISNSVLVGGWSTDLAIDNPNDKLSAYFDRIQSFVYYSEPKNFLAWNTEAPFSLDTKETGTMRMKITTINSDQPAKEVVVEVEKARASGRVNFGLGLGMVGTFRSGSWWSRHVSMRVYCDDLQVSFVGATGDGTLKADHKHRQCVVYT